MKATLRCRISYALLAGLLVCSPAGAADPPANSITVVSNHLTGDSKAELTAKGGLSMYVKVDGKVILFDTGWEASPLLQNLGKLGLDPTRIEAVVLSHIETDGHPGLGDLLSATGMKPKVYVPEPGGRSILRENPDAQVVVVSEPTGVLPDAWLVGPIRSHTEKGTTIEQVLVLDQPDGLVVIVGCSFPGIAAVVEQVKEVFGARRIDLVTGGFHLQGTPKKEIREISLSLQQKGVKDLALSQCTGKAALKIFHQEWGNRVVSLDFGKTIRF
jgi:7,8-dihydropterin-6-yl-methyl-4-(beta-D-ribofuranosyl)aminobenzene 5'-phosphate synthase